MLKIGNIFCLLLYITSSLELGAGQDVLETGPAAFKRIAEASTSPFHSDKVSNHAYHQMYGSFLLPLVNRIHSDMKRGVRFLEIGLGCAQPGKKKGVDIWASLFNRGPYRDEVTIVEMRKKCAQKMIAAGMIPKNISLLYGDQSNPEVVAQWAKDAPNLDIIIDDGGHSNKQILTSFTGLWDTALAPGGLYFIEDLQVGRHKDYEDSNNDAVFADVIQSWVEQLLIHDKKNVHVPKKAEHGRFAAHPLPSRLKGIYCQVESCVLEKCEIDDVARCTK